MCMQGAQVFAKTKNRREAQVMIFEGVGSCAFIFQLLRVCLFAL